jgi:hypothetical protein
VIQFWAQSGRVCRLYTLVAVALLAGTVVACDSIWLAEAKRSLAASLECLPEPDGFAVLTVITGQSAHHWRQQKCYIAQALVAVGTDLPREEALWVYASALETEGWTPHAGEIPAIETLEFRRGEHETLSADVLVGPGPIIGSDKRYLESKDKYRTIVHIVHDYLLPTRTACLGE